uniref:Uncharacterized protein n=1 Tax=Tetranychus urticae TaxID=32264 RepID=T1KN79_TETUR
MSFEGKPKDLTVEYLKAFVKTFYYNACTPYRFLMGYRTDDADSFLREFMLSRAEIFVFGPRDFIYQLHDDEKQY